MEVFLAVIDRGVGGVLRSREGLEGKASGLEKFCYALEAVRVLIAEAAAFALTLSMSLSCWIRSALLKGWKGGDSASALGGEDILLGCCLA